MNFFDPHAGSSDLFAMGAAGHAALLALLFGLLALLVLYRKDLRRLRASRVFMAGTAAFILASELTASSLQVFFPIQHAWERLPLHLCASLKIALATLILLERYDLAKFISVWAIGAGFISFANLNLNGGTFDSFMFWHYVWGHLYLFLMPILLFLSGEFRYDLPYQARSMFGLFLWSLAIFFVNWAFDANYMYTGPHNDTAVPFIPERYMVWPLNYVSYVLAALVLLNLVCALMRFCQERMDGGSAKETESATTSLTQCA